MGDKNGWAFENVYIYILYIYKYTFIYMYIYTHYMHICAYMCICEGRQVALEVKNPSANAGDIRDAGSIPGSGRSPGRGRGNPLQYSCLENLGEDPGELWFMGSQRVRHD